MLCTLLALHQSCILLKRINKAFDILFFLPTVPASQQNPESVVVSVSNISAYTGSQTLLVCQSYRMVWTQDNLLDRQRVLHWDLISSQGSYRGERLLDMFSAGEQRLYGGYNQGRILVSQSAFRDGNFSLVIKGIYISVKFRKTLKQLYTRSP